MFVTKIEAKTPIGGELDRFSATLGIAPCVPFINHCKSWVDQLSYKPRNDCNVNEIR